MVTEKGETVVLNYATAKPERIRGLAWWRAILALTMINLLMSCPLFILTVAKRYSEFLDLLAYFRCMSIAGIALGRNLDPPRSWEANGPGGPASYERRCAVPSAIMDAEVLTRFSAFLRQ